MFFIWRIHLLILPGTQICLTFFCSRLNIGRLLLCSFSSLLANIYWTHTLASAVLTAWYVYTYARSPWNNLWHRQHYGAQFVSEETEAQGVTRLTCPMPEVTLITPGASQLCKNKRNHINWVYWVIYYYSWWPSKSLEELEEEDKLYLWEIGRRCGKPTQRG